ncbi:ATP-binding protein [Acinetobacter pittii]|uniref:ATP-binding protein n=1 Tax=Acinetobacter pittii TaxID=48296 RepID=UPI002E18041D|nr:ATP-binding protein [Acinetobacter pittii]
MSKMLSDIINIQRHFLRSVNLKLDFGRDDAIQGYILQPSVKNLLATTANHLTQTQQKAFTWTGPYGGGKSLLALTLASLASGKGNLSHSAKTILESDQTQELIDYFSTTKPWLVLPITGTRSSIETEIQTTLNEVLPLKANTKKNVIQQLKIVAEKSSEHEGVLLIIDELGKFLEHAAYTGEDIGFYQELAETAARCKGKFVVIGILHQAFEQYASRLGPEIQQEWAKVQGRYIDIPLFATADETLSLIGKAIQTDFSSPQHKQLSEKIAQFCRNQPQQNFAQLLDMCWPLHPLTALMLGPSSRKRYGQNERSVFSFLTSAEPLGFAQLTQTLNIDGLYSLYWPYHFWDYLKVNFEPTILSSTDGRQWSLSLEAIQRTEAIYSQLHIQIIKTISLIELFRSSLGLYSTQALLHASIPANPLEIDKALKELAQSSILIFRKHVESWAIYAGSDFDIEEAIKAAKKQVGPLEPSKISQVLELTPIIARRHYAEKGAIRWLNRTIVLEKDTFKHLKTINHSGNACGEFLLVLPSKNHSPDSLFEFQRSLSLKAPKGVVIGTSVESQILLDQLQELNALDYVRTHYLELHTDKVAMRELDARIQLIRLKLKETLQNLFNSVQWQYQGETKSGNLTQLASEIADSIYYGSPTVLSELINRNILSSNAVKAQKELLRAMLNHSHLENLGFEKMSAPAGLYHTTIKTLGMHRLIDNAWQICKPEDTEKSISVHAMWLAAEKLLFKARKTTSLQELYKLWTQEPFGLKKGLLPIFALSFYLANRTHLAIYMDGMFTPDITEATLDEWLQDPKRVTWRFIKLASSEQEILRALTNALSKQTHLSISHDPLDSARALVSIVYSIQAWTRRTEQLTPETKKLRQLLLHASDPYKVLFVDIPTLLETFDANTIAHRVSVAATELVTAFDKRLRLIEMHVMQALDHTSDWESLCQRGKNVIGIGADFKLEAFIARISTYQGQLFDIEGLLMLAISKPSKDWSDHDIDAGEVQLLQWAHAFRRLEVVAHLRDKPSNRRGIGIVFGNQQTITGLFDVAEQDQEIIERLSSQLLIQLNGEHYKKEVFLAALVEAGAHILQDLNQVD